MQQISSLIDPLSRLGQYMACPVEKRDEWLKSQEWFCALPDDRVYRCQLCQDTGHILDGQGRARDCGCIHGLSPTKQENNKYIALHDLLSIQHWEGWPVWEFEEFEKQPNFQTTKCYNAGKKLILSQEKNFALVMIGQSGRGKTYTGLQIISWAAKRGLDAMVFRWDEMISWYQRGSQDDGYYQKKIERRQSWIKKLDVVFIDEIGRGENSNPDHAKNLINWIIRDCYRQRSLILASNMVPDEFYAYLDTSVLSRLSGWATMVYEEIGTNDLRQR